MFVEIKIEKRDKEDKMSVTVKQMMDAANAIVPRITPAQGRDLMAERNTLVWMCATPRRSQIAARWPAP